jgi:hypothetical protein
MAVIIPILSKFDNSGIRHAKSQFRTLKNVFRTGLGIVGISASIRGLIDVAKAADADIKSQKLLTTQLQRTAHANTMATTNAEAFIQKLSSQVGIIDDNLRPSLGALAAVTGNTTKAQKLLTVTLDLAAASGKDQSTVQKAVAKAYAGNAMSLKRMFPELIKVTAGYEKQHGKAKTLKQKTDEARFAIDSIGKTYQGIAAQQATPFQKMNQAMDDLKEAIGMAVLPELSNLVNYLTTVAVPKIKVFFEALANPKTDVGAAFKNLKEDVRKMTNSFGDFFKLFSGGKGGAVGFINFVDLIVKNAGVIIGVMASFKAIKFLTQPIGKTSILGGLLKLFSMGSFLKGGVIGAEILAILGLKGDTSTVDKKGKSRALYAPTSPLPGLVPLKPNGLPFSMGRNSNNVTININGVIGDKVSVGKAVKEALTAYDKKNGNASRINSGMR